jgi:hypothetical protein
MLILSIIVWPPQTWALLEPPAPYTTEALRLLVEANERVTPLIPPKGLQRADDDTKKRTVVQSIYGHWQALYKEAGYSFEKSLVQLAKDLEANPALPQTAPQLQLTAFRITYMAYQQLAQVNHRDLIVANYLPRSAGDAFAKLIAIEEAQRQLVEDQIQLEDARAAQARKKEQDQRAAQAQKAQERLKEQEATLRRESLEVQIEQQRLAQEAKKAEQARLQKEQDLQKDLTLQRLQAIAGRYQSKGMTTAPNGELDLTVKSAREVTVNGYDNEPFKGKPNCQFTDVSAEVRKVDSNEIELVLKDLQMDKCQMLFKITPSYNSINFYNIGGKQCPSYCKEIGFFSSKWIAQGH